MCWGKDRLGAILQSSLTTALSQLRHKKPSCHFKTAFLLLLLWTSQGHCLLGVCNFTEQTNLSDKLSRTLIMITLCSITRIFHAYTFRCFQMMLCKILGPIFLYNVEVRSSWNFKILSCLQLMLWTQVLWWGSLRSPPALLDVDMNWAWTPSLWKFPMPVFQQKPGVFFIFFFFATFSHVSLVGLELLSLWPDSHFH